MCRKLMGEAWVLDCYRTECAHDECQENGQEAEVRMVREVEGNRMLFLPG